MGRRDYSHFDAARLEADFRGGAVVGEPEIRRLAAAGLQGVEVDHPDHAPDDRAELRRLAAELDLIVTGSSDFHGSRKVQGLGAETTADGELARLLAAATGVAAVSGRGT